MWMIGKRKTHPGPSSQYLLEVTVLLVLHDNTGGGTRRVETVELLLILTTTQFLSEPHTTTIIHLTISGYTARVAIVKHVCSGRSGNVSSMKYENLK